MNALVLLVFLFLKTGEKFATPEAAGPTVASFTSYMAEQVGGVKFAPVVMNDPQKAVEFVAVKKPAAGIVTPGFYLAHAEMMTPVLEVKRAWIPSEKFVLVARKSADWKGKPVATTLAAESRYVGGVVLQEQLGRDAQLKPVTDVENALFDLAEGKGSASAVLAEAAAWKLFAGDPDLTGKLTMVYESAELPGPLVVVFKESAGKLDADRLKQALKKMGETEEGKKMLASIRVAAFVDVDRERLRKAEARFRGE